MSRSTYDESTLEELPAESRRPAAHDDLHIVLECDRPLAGSTRHCVDDIDEIVFRRSRDRRFTREMVSGIRRLTLELPDSHMSSRHARLRRVEGRWRLEDTDSRNGCYLEGRRVQSALLSDGAMFEFGHTHFLLRSREIVRHLFSGARDVVSSPGPATAIALGTLNHEHGASFARMLDATRAGVAVLLVGEAGSGKDTVARAVHALTGRRGELVVLHCGLLGRGRDSAANDDDVAAELTRDFERAAGGTLFLDELDALSSVAQLALLTLLRSPGRKRVAGILSSVRSSEPRPRIPRLPADLLSELAGFAMLVPPLRDRQEDLGNLVAEILARAGAADRASMRMDPVMGQALVCHDWPYNISELENCLRSALAMSADGCMRWSSPALLYAHAPAARAGERAGEGEDATSSVRGRVASAEGSSSESTSGPDVEFSQDVRRALKCNLSLSGLQKNGLLHSHMVLEATKGSPAATSTVPALRDVVLTALEALRKSSPRGAKQARVLDLTFIEPASTQQEAADRLAMAFGTYRRYVTSALAELTSILWFSELSARQCRERVEAVRDAGARQPAMIRSV